MYLKEKHNDIFDPFNFVNKTVPEPLTNMEKRFRKNIREIRLSAVSK